MKKVLIVGAGPAGSSSAIQLLKAGHQVTILDRSKFPRKTPGETLHPGIEPLLKQLGVLDEILSSNFLRHKGIENVINGLSSYEAYNEEEHWKGFQLFREEFDAILLKKAINLGAEFQSGLTPVKVNQSASAIASVETGTDKFEADFFIDATGKRAWLAQNFQIEVEEYSPKRIAYYGYVKNSDFKPAHPQLIWDEKGWTWISYVKENLIAWVRLNLIQHEKVDTHWFPEYLVNGNPTDPRKAVDVTWRKAKTCCKENCFLIGDAAFVLDPGSSHGILKAIMSGIMVAHLINQSTNYPKSVIENHYNQWINNQFDNDRSNLIKLYERIRNENQL